MENGTEAQVLDVLDVPLIEAQPSRFQPENWVIADKPWQLRNRPAKAEDMDLLDHWIVRGPDILGNQEDRVPAASFASTPAASSLALVRPTTVRWLRDTDFHGKDRVRVVFTLRGVEHRLPLTDPVWEKKLVALPLGLHPRSAGGLAQQDRILLTVSMGGEFHGDCYKFVAGIVVLP